MDLRVIGCDGSYPSANGACSGYLVQHEDNAILLDCGSGVLSKLMALTDPAKLKAIIITHWHHDHASDLLVLQYYLLIHQKTLIIYAPLDDNPLKIFVSAKSLISEMFARFRISDLLKLRCCLLLTLCLPML